MGPQLPDPGSPTQGLLTRVDAMKDLSPGKVFSSLVEIFKPEIFTRRPRHVLKPTSWLDGLRGWAAFSVVCLHLCVYTHPMIEHCYGSDMGDGKRLTTPGALPFIRLFFSGGHFAVMLFFTISGYVIAMRPLQLLHENRAPEFVEAINSAMVRRPLRLYLPVIWSTLFFACAWHIFGIATPWPDRQSNLFWELIAWVRETGKFVDFFRMGFLFTYYNIHTWTIPVELRGSMYLFIWLFAMHQLENRTRIISQVGMIILLAILSPAGWYACFFSGMLTSELDMLGASVAGVTSTAAISLPWDGAFRWLREQKTLRWVILHMMLLGGLWLGGQPSSDDQTQDEILNSCLGWPTLNRMIPNVYRDEHGTFRWFWLFWAAWMTLVSVKEIPWARAIFEARFSQCKFNAVYSLFFFHFSLKIDLMIFSIQSNNVLRPWPQLLRLVPPARAAHRHRRRASLLPSRRQEN